MSQTPPAGRLDGSRPYTAPFETDAGAAEPDDDLAIVPTSTDPNQLALRLPGSRARPKPQRRRYSSYEWAILDYVAGSLVVTEHQILYRFAIYDAKHPSPVRRALTKLYADGLLEARRLDPDLGRASRHVAALTHAGWKFVGRSPQRAPFGAPRHVLDQCLQAADFRLEHEARGWVRVTDQAAAWGVLRAWGVRAARRRGLPRRDPFTMERIFRMRPAELPCELWFHFRTGAVQLTLPSRRGINLVAQLEALPDLGLWPVLPLQLIGADPARTGRDRDRVRAWATRRRREFDVRVPKPYYQRLYPGKHPKLRRSLYDTYGTVTPRAMAKLPLIGAYATRLACAHISDHPLMPHDVLDLAETRLIRPFGPY